MARRPTSRTCARLKAAYYQNVAACERFWVTKQGNPRRCKAAHKTGAAWFRLCAAKGKRRGS